MKVLNSFKYQKLMNYIFRYLEIDNSRIYINHMFPRKITFITKILELFFCTLF